jgi:hypothetical protein
MNTYYIIAIILVIFLIYWYYSPNTNQRIFPDRLVPENPINLYPQMIVATSDIKYPSDKMFLIRGYNYDSDYKSFPHIFKNEEERKKIKNEAKQYFKKQFGLSDFFLDSFMLELTVNPEINYRAYYLQNTNSLNNKMTDGGFIVYVPPYTKLYGRYGGKNGVSSSKQSTLAYGHYKITDNSSNSIMTIRYESQCPLQTFSTYDADYSPVDCDIQIINSQNKAEIGLNGKAQGIHRNMMIKNPKKNHILIKNVMTFYK